MQARGFVSPWRDEPVPRGLTGLFGFDVHGQIISIGCEKLQRYD
ncbi:hypothetical protein ADILRU_0179 [Leifsonia rubra CMS 76R]|nr:hypothetical protein ADILRU_0179 [Leifsonia rubra CMS 76R]